MNIYLE